MEVGCISNPQYKEVGKAKFGLVGYFYSPTDAKDNPDIPLIIYLGGQGERVNSWGLTKMLTDGYCPNAYVYAPSNQYVNAQGLHGIVKNAVKTLNIKPDKVYIWGYSLGGHQGLQMISDNPKFYKGIVVFGACPNRYFPCANITKSTTSFIVYRGERESGGLGVKIENFAKQMEQSKRNVEFVSLPNVNHTGYGCVVNEELVEKLISL